MDIQQIIPAFTIAVLGVFLVALMWSTLRHELGDRENRQMLALGIGSVVLVTLAGIIGIFTLR